MLEAGVTSIRQLGDPRDAILEVKRMLGSRELAGPRLFVAGPIFTAPGGHPAYGGRDPNASGVGGLFTFQSDDPAAVRTEVARLAASGVDGIKAVLHGAVSEDGRILVPTLSDATFEALVAEAKARDLWIAVHIGSTHQAGQAARAGVTTVEHGIRNGNRVDDATLDALVENGVVYVATLGHEPDGHLAIPALHAAGVLFGVGTDEGDYHDELGRLAAAGVPPAEVLVAATRNGAARCIATKTSARSNKASWPTSCSCAAARGPISPTPATSSQSCRTGTSSSIGGRIPSSLSGGGVSGMARLWLLALALAAANCFAADDEPVFPGKEWQRVAPSEAGFSEARVAALRTWLETQRTTGLLVVVNGRVVLEYGDVARLSKVASVRKSVLAMLYGRYVENGTIDLERTVADVGLDDTTPFLPQERDATLRHVLMARSGIYLPAGNKQLEDLMPVRGSHSPGTFFQYQNWDFNAAGAAFEQLTGRDIFDALESDLARPLGFQDFERARQRKNDMAPSRFPEYAMYLSARDMARSAC